jgi:L-malate glycosyltransferase
MTPSPAQVHLGSGATVRRYREGLQLRGHLCEVLGGTDEGGLRQSLDGTVARFRPDLVHAHDALRSGVALLGLRTPWVVSVRGEDLHHDMLDARHGPLVCEVLRRARRVLVPTPEAGRLVEERVPDTVGKIDVVRRSAGRLPTGGTDLRRSLGIPTQRFLVFLPGAIHPLKAQLRAVPLIGALRAIGSDAEMIVAGPERDADYAAELRRRCAPGSGVRVLPPLATDRMGAAYVDADVVLNTSACEGMAATLLEAAMLGRPIVASDVPGNRELIRHAATGLLFGSDEDLVQKVAGLWRDRGAAGAYGVRVREDVQRRFAGEQEIADLLSAYAAA